jgi:hypothetical protein
MALFSVGGGEIGQRRAPVKERAARKPPPSPPLKKAPGGDAGG